MPNVYESNVTPWLAMVTVVAASLFIGMCGLNGCSGISTACQKALPVLATANAYFGDAENRLSQAESIIVRIADPKIREDGLRVVTQLRVALTAAQSQIVAASKSCSTMDVGVAFSEFIATWPKLAPFIAMLGGDGQSVVGTPLVISRGQQ